MAPLTPTWPQPSHPTIQEVHLPSDPSQFTTKSLSKVNLAPYAVFAKMAFPPCTRAKKATYATVQMGRDEHLNLNSDLIYINHSCDPSLIFDMSSQNIIASGRGLKIGEELTFFYPSTEWDMDQGFSCFCGTDSCLGYISGAKHMQLAQLEGHFLNAHIRSLLEERETSSSPSNNHPAIPLAGNAKAINGQTPQDPTATALHASLDAARKMLDAAQNALDTYISIHSDRENGVGSRALSGEMGGDTRRGVTSREMSGEMGGDTVVV